MKIKSLLLIVSVLLIATAQAVAQTTVVEEAAVRVPLENYLKAHASGEDFIEQVKIPVQFHYGTRDSLIPNEDVEKLRVKLSAKNNRPEIYIYEGAQHGFANLTGETYRADYAALAEKRWRTFFPKHL